MAIPEFILQVFLDQVLGFLTEKTRSAFQDTLTKKQIKEAIRNASIRFENEFPNRELAKALNNNTRFHDLPVIRESINYFLEHPFDSIPKIQIRDQFKSTLPISEHRYLDEAVNFYLERLQEELIGVEKLQSILSLIYKKRIAEASERTANGVEELLTKNNISQMELEEALRKYLRYMIDTNQYIDPRGIVSARQAINFRLDEIYVSLTAEYDIRDYVDIDKIRDRLRNEMEDLPTPTVWEGFIGGHKISRSKKESFILSDVTRKNSRSVILGDPGSGKTTILRFLIVLFATQYTPIFERFQNNLVIDRENNIYGTQRLPIYFRAGNYADSLTNNRNLSVRSFIIDDISGITGNQKSIHVLLENAIDSGDALILIDGLDEVVETSGRAEVCRRIEQFVASCNPDNRFVITSRISGYRAVPLIGNFSHFTVNELDDTQIQSFLSKWYPLLERLQQPNISLNEISLISRRRINAMLDALKSNSGIRRLATNPLMLTILILVFREEENITLRRYHIYEKAVNILLRDWQTAKGLSQITVIKPNEVIYILAPLAYWIQNNKPSRIATSREIKKILGETIREILHGNVDEFSLSDKAEDFFSRSIDTGVLVEFSPDKYGFVHLTFQEYLVANYLHQQQNNLHQLVYNYKHNPSWQESILLLISYFSKEDKDIVVSIIKRAILCKDFSEEKAFLPSTYEELLHRDIMFAVRAICECTFEKEFYEVLAEFFDWYYTYSSQEKFEPLVQRMNLLIDLLIESGKSDIVVKMLRFGMSNTNSPYIAYLISKDLSRRKFVGKKITFSKAIKYSLKSGGNRSKFNNTLIDKDVVKRQWFVKRIDESIKKLSDIEEGNESNSFAFPRQLMESTDDSRKDMEKSRIVFQVPVNRSNAGKLLNDNFKPIESYPNLVLTFDSDYDDLKLFIINALHNYSGLVRYEAVQFIRKSNFGFSDFGQEFWRLLNDPVDEVCVEVAGTLIQWNVHDKRLIDWLVTALGNEENPRRFRSYIFQAFVAINEQTPEIVNILLQALRDKDWYIRGEAASILGSLGVCNKNVVKVLFSKLDDPIDHVKVKAAEALGKISGNPKTDVFYKDMIALSAYQALLSSNFYKDKGVADAIWEALWQATSKN